MPEGFGRHCSAEVIRIRNDFIYGKLAEDDCQKIFPCYKEIFFSESGMYGNAARKLYEKFKK